MQTKIEKINPLSALAINNYNDQGDSPCDFLSFREKLSLAVITHSEKRREWQGARTAIKWALECINRSYPGFYKDEHGKSHPMDDCGYVSLTHSHGLAAAIFHKEMPVGIDLEFIRDKAVKLGTKFLDPSEIEFLEDDPVHFTIAWSAKETIYKCQGRKGISLKQNIRLEPFGKHQKIIHGKVHGTDSEDLHCSVQVNVEKGMVLTYTVW